MMNEGQLEESKSNKQTDLRERTGYGMGRDKSNFDLTYILDDEHGNVRYR